MNYSIKCPRCQSESHPDDIHRAEVSGNMSWPCGSAFYGTPTSLGEGWAATVGFKESRECLERQLKIITNRNAELERPLPAWVENVKSPTEKVKNYKKLRPNLKQCPFCGGENLYWGHANAHSFHVQCLTCGGSGAEINYPDELPDEWSDISIEEIECRLMRKAIEAWNERIPVVEEQFLQYFLVPI